MIGLCLVIVSCILVIPQQAAAAADDVTVTPAVIDREGIKRDVFSEELTVTNTGNSRLHLYPTVRNLTADGGIEAFAEPNTPAADKTISLANWIELGRGQIVVDPGESRSIPVTIRVNLRAKPGVYHAVIAFPSGRNRALAEQKLTETGQSVITVAVNDDIREALSLLQFEGTYALTADDPVTLTYEVENGGNAPVQPRGEIILYDRQGKKLDTIPANPDGLTIPAGGSVSLASVWEGARRTGRFKAYLSLEYGEAQLQRVNDTAFFWVIPLPLLAGLFAALLLGSLGFVMYMHRRSLAKHRVRLDAWHKESAERHKKPEKQRIKGLPHGPQQQRNQESRIRNQGPGPASGSDTPGRPPLRVNGNIIDLRGGDQNGEGN